MNMNLSLIFTWILFCFIHEESQSAVAKGGCSTRYLKPKNGRYKVKARGRIVKFYCNSGYDLYGRIYNTCTGGKWNHPTPVCVKSKGCGNLTIPIHGTLLERFDGAVATYECYPGYELNGSSTIYCDGEMWNDTIPNCSVATLTPSTSCDFEAGLCGWIHDPTGDFYWVRHQFATPSGHVGTGPNHDHTHGEGKAGYYLYLEASNPRKIQDTARLYSPVYSPNLSTSCFTFWYHMYGSGVGSLRVYIKTDEDHHPNLLPFWQKDGEQGNVWLKATLPVHPLHDNFQIVIEGVRGDSYIGDIAIDDVSLEFENCQEDNTSSSCQRRCGQDDTKAFCSCSFNCSKAYNCCDDFAVCILEQNVTASSSVPTPSVTVIINDTSNYESTVNNVISSANSSLDDDNSTATSSVISTTYVDTTTETEWPITKLRIETITNMQLETTSPDSVNFTVKPTRYSRTRWWVRKIKPSSLKSSESQKPLVDYVTIGAFLGLLILISGSIVTIYLWRRRHKKLAEDSDVRYLAENEIIEYSEGQRNSSVINI